MVPKRTYREVANPMDSVDFDGDALNAMIQLDLSLLEPLSNLLPHKSALDFESPGELSKNLSLSKPSVSIFNNWMQFNDNPDPQKVGKMIEFAA
jgi:hypothetical protein